MRILLLFVIVLTLSVTMLDTMAQDDSPPAGAPPGTPTAPPILTVAQVLDDFHAAASEADLDRYIGHFAQNGVFLGTAPDERWTVAEFRTFARPYFEAGTGWTYTPITRHVALAPDRTIAWFDELLDNTKYGQCRGTGVLTRVDADHKWQIAQYNLTFVLPNECAMKALEACADSTK